ncbi:DNA/RNA non-specific endonuclease [Mesorhizobium sp.]|uniref:DNA/RNA non-specific endonuclease n=1 Tax=Mesorhizobium sp. TaxID=1871066 RepID=UPI000FE974FF|nr:DNA/RNA non-specific endonuclease [Mesorhizobium sp.]RWE30516.1 MAG: DNA/RNA non-specific endonuclease [Mesorhizobium sp.]
MANVDPKVDPVGFATGFMVSPNVLLTNWHVFPDPGSVRGTGANFLHDETASGVARGIIFEFDPQNGQTVVLKYHHFSLAMNASRRMQMWSAVNVDYDASKKTSNGRAFFGQDRWVFDPRIPQQYQLGDPDIYAPANQIDRGHIVRREDNALG